MDQNKELKKHGLLAFLNPDTKGLTITKKGDDTFYDFEKLLDKEADDLEKAVQDVLDEGLRTKDIVTKGTKEVSTTQMGDAIISKLQ